MNVKKQTSVELFGKVAQWVVGVPLIALIAAGLVSLTVQVVRWGFGW